MTFIDYTESPYFYTMADIFIDWTPENPKSPMANEYLPAVEQDNNWKKWFKVDPTPTLFTTENIARVRRQRMIEGYYETQV